MTRAENTSTVESRPKPTSAIEDATAPATIATTASVTFQATVAQASKRARRSKLAEVGEFGMSGLAAAVQLDVAWLADQRHSVARSDSRRRVLADQPGGELQRDHSQVR